MAFVMARVWFNTFEIIKAKFSPFYAESINLSRRQFKKKREEINKIPKGGPRKHRNLIKSSLESLAARDFLRSYKPYTPPPNIKEKVLDVCLRVLGTDFRSSAELSRKDKFEILSTCFKEFNQGVPNSLLHTMITCNDIVKFYETPVIKTTPYDELKNQELPPNLHVEKNYKRFDPDCDSVFGITAFPQSSTIVTGIKYKNKYKGYKPVYSVFDNEEFFKKENVFKCS